MLRTYRYGVRVLREHEEPPEVGEQLIRRTRYWNQLVELQQHYEADVEAVLAPLITGETEEERRASRKVAWQQEHVRAAQHDLERVLWTTQRQLRGSCGLYWGSYLDVERSWAVARQRDRHRLRFHRSSDSEGTLAVRIQPPKLVPAVYAATAGPFAMERPPEALRGESPRQYNRRCWMPFRFRVGVEPVSLTGVACIDRPLPEAGLVREVRLKVDTRNGHKGRLYELLLTVEEPDALAQDGPAWGVDVGWRRVEGGLRVAVAVSQAGERRELVLPDALLGLHQRAADLHSTIDTHRDVIRAWLLQQQLPEGSVEHLAQWRSPARFHRLYQDLVQCGEASPVMDRLRGWHRQSTHLEEYLRGTVERAQRWRRDLYGQWTSRLVAEAGTIAIEDTNWRLLAQDDDEGYTGGMRHIASPGELLDRLRQTAVREGVALTKVPAEHTTLLCSWCGHRNTYDAAPFVMVRCAGCGRRYDQDVNAARNLLARIVSAPAAGTGPARESRWGRIKRQKEAAGQRQGAL